MPFDSRSNAGWSSSFFLYFVPLAFATMSILALFAWLDNRQKVELLMSREVAKTLLLQQRMSRELEQTKADLQTLAQLPPILEWIEVPSPRAEERMVFAFSAFSKWHKLYDHVRFINVKGMERIRVNLMDDKTVALPKEKLQYKGDRDFFIDAIHLERGGVFISPLTLNMNREPGEEIKPTVRISTPIIDAHGDKVGVLVINMIAEEILSWLNEDSNLGNASAIELLNAEGFWLHSVDPKKEWAFMYGKDESFARSNPMEWRQINVMESGQFHGSEGLVTFRTIRMPVKDSTLSQNYWKLVSRITNQKLSQSSWLHRWEFWLIAAIMLSLIALMSARLATAIHRKRQAETLIRESEEHFRAISERSTVGKSLTAPDGKLLQVNNAFANILGYSIQEMVQINFAEITHPDDIAKSRESLRVLLDDEQSVYRFEKRYIHKNGAIVWVDLSTTLLRDDQGTPLYFITSITDLTERKRFEEENRRLQERLQRSEKMEALGTLAGGVAHDLNNVLGIVVGYAELILESADVANSVKPHLMNIMNGGQKAAAIVNDLLTLARRGVSGKDVLNLNKIIADCQQSPEFEKLSSCDTSIKITTDFDPDLPNIAGSSVHLGKSLYNLVCNACEAMTKGGKVAIKTTHQYMDKAIQGYDEIRCGDYVILSVSDTGEGIKNDDLKHIFEPFYTKKVMGRSGTGLGLAVVWGTVKDHQGYINVESEEGKGTTFTLYFPVTRENISAEAAPVAISEYMGKGESILVVDDVKEQRNLAAEMLSTLNYNVSGVASGEEAVAYLKEHAVDLMVLDMIMDPGLDGLDTYRGSLQINPKQKAIIVSGFSESDRVEKAQSLGAGSYVKKPYIKEKLGLAVRKELDRK